MASVPTESNENPACIKTIQVFRMQTSCKPTVGAGQRATFPHALHFAQAKNRGIQVAGGCPMVASASFNQVNSIRVPSLFGLGA